jgi:hypothetical protein
MDRADQLLVASDRERVRHPGDEVTNGSQLLGLAPATPPRLW